MTIRSDPDFDKVHSLKEAQDWECDILGRIYLQKMTNCYIVNFNIKVVSDIFFILLFLLISPNIISHFVIFVLGMM